MRNTRFIKIVSDTNGSIYLNVDMIVWIAPIGNRTAIMTSAGQLEFTGLEVTKLLKLIGGEIG